MSTFCKAEVSGLTFSCGGMNQPELCHEVDSGKRERSASYARADAFTAQEFSPEPDPP